MGKNLDETATAATSGSSPVGQVVGAPGGRAPAMLGRYVVVRELGEGGMGVVYAAHDPQLDREVAIKLLRARVRSAAEEERARARLVREGRAMAKLVHPNVIRVYDLGLHAGQVFVAMELIDGGTLADWQASGPRPWREVLAIYLGAGRGLAAAHRAGIVHRDFKPANVLLARDGRVLVTDFGIARLEDGEEASCEDAGAPGEVAVTQTGAILGTPEYMSPELVRGAPVDARADQFAFCVALYRALYGERPFVSPSGASAGQTPVEEVKQMLLAGQLRPPPRGTDVPGWVREHVLRGLRLDPAERFPDMDALLAALAADPAVRRRRVLGGLAAVALVGLAAWGLVRGGRSATEPCGGAAELLAGAWDGPARARVESAFLATGKPFARTSFARVAARLDGYAGEWAGQRTQACRATRVRHEQSEALLELRVACLDERRAGLAALVAQLASADAALVEHALDVANRLDPLASCADTADLQAEMPPPRDPAVAERVRGLRARFEAVAAMNKAGKYQEALALARPLADEAEATGFAPLAGRVRLELGNIEISLNQMDAARQDLDRAVILAGEARTDRLLAGALAQLAGQESVARKDEEAAQSARLAEALALRQHDTEALGSARMTRAILLQRQGHVAEATELRKDVLASYERDFGRSDPRLLRVLNPLASGAMVAGRLGDAQAWAQRALDLTVEIYGPDHPLVADALNALATLAQRRGDDRAAIPLYERALGVAERAYGPEHPSIATLSHNLAIVHFGLAQYDEAGRLWQRALALTEKLYGPAHPEMCKVLAALAQLRSVQGHPEEAIELTRRAIDILTRADGPMAPGLSTFYANLALFTFEKGDLAGALAMQQKSLDQTAQVEGKDSDAYGTGLSRLTRFLVADGRCGEALPLTAEAIRLLEKHVGPDSLRLRRPLELRAQCLTRAGRPGEAFPLIERVAAMVTRAGGDESDQAAERLLRADALWVEGKDRKRARAEAARAEEALAAAKGIDGDADKKAVLAEVRAWRKGHPWLRGRQR